MIFTTEPYYSATTWDDVLFPVLHFYVISLLYNLIIVAFDIFDILTYILTTLEFFISIADFS